MTNLQDGADRHAARLQQRLLLVLPIGMGAVLAVLVLGAGVVPQWLKLQADSERLAQLEEIKARIPLLRAQIATAAETQGLAERKQLQVLQLIQGSGELVTFLAQLDREASRQGVQIYLYEPMAAIAPVTATAAKKGEQAPPSPASPLEAAGLKAQKLLLTARGSYPSLLAFLRATEKLNLLVEQSDLSLTALEPPKAAAQVGSTAVNATSAAAPVAAKTELKLILTYYQGIDEEMAKSNPTKP